MVVRAARRGRRRLAVPGHPRPAGESGDSPGGRGGRGRDGGSEAAARRAGFGSLVFANAYPSCIDWAYRLVYGVSTALALRLLDLDG